MCSSQGDSESTHRLLHFLTPVVQNMSIRYKSHQTEVSADTFVSLSPFC